MDGFIFIILLFFAFLLLMACFISSLKGKRAAYLTAVTATLSAWFAGLLLDANIDFGMDLSFRILFPLLAMGICILNFIVKNKTDG